MAAIDRAMQSGAAAARRSPQRPDAACSTATTTKPPRPRTTALPERARVRRERTAGDGEGSARLLPHQPSAGRARSDARAPTARTPRPTAGQARRTAPKCSWAACSRRSSSRTPRIRGPAARTPSTRCATWKTSTASCGASSGPSSSPSSAQLVQADAILAIAGDGRPPARRRGSEPDRQRTDPARRSAGPLHQRRRDPRPRRRARHRGARDSSAKSSAAIPGNKPLQDSARPGRRRQRDARLPEVAAWRSTPSCAAASKTCSARATSSSSPAASAPRRRRQRTAAGRRWRGVTDAIAHLLGTVGDVL